jgi:type I restriction enzyme S subunit
MWETVKLGDVLKTGAGGTPLKSKKEYYEGGDINWLLSGAVCEKEISRSSTFISTAGLQNSSAKLFPPNTVLVAMYGATAGQVGILRVEAATNQAVCGIYPNDNYLPEFIYYFLLSYKNILLEEVSGVAQPNLSQVKIKNIPIPLPPLAEQQRIVAKLDAAFAEIDTAIGAAEKNARNAEAIYAYAINAMFAEHSDKAVKIGDYAKINYGYTAKASHDNGEYKFLRITDIQDGTVNWQSVPYCDVESKKISSVLLKDGDIVFARTGATTGKSFLVRNPINAVFASYLIRVSLDKEAFLPDFVLHYFQSEEYWRQVDEGTSGAAQGGFNASKLSRLMLPLISIDEQINLTEHLNKISQQSSSLKEMYLSKAKKLDTLKSSLLAAELNNMSEAA